MKVGNLREYSLGSVNFTICEPPLPAGSAGVNGGAQFTYGARMMPALAKEKVQLEARLSPRRGGVLAQADILGQVCSS